MMETINGIDLLLFVLMWLFANLWLAGRKKPNQEPIKQGEQYFNDELKNHLKCQLDITEYLCQDCHKVGYRLLRCNEASDCVDEAVGIAVQFEHDCYR